MANNLEEAKQQYLHLTSSECSLSEHFSLNNIWNVYICFGGTENNQAYYKRRRRYQMCVIRHSLDLFQHCHILLSPIFSKSLTSTDVQEIHTYLNILESVNPSQIELNLQTMNNPIPFNLRYWLTQELFNNQTILNCQHLKIIKSDKNEPGTNSIFNWLHYRKINVNGKNNHFDRSLIIHQCETIGDSLEELIEKCKKNLLQSESTADHKPFIFGFCSKTTLNEFYLENNKSKEIILLENLKPENGLQTVYYLLRRCELNKEKNQREYCQKMFKTFKEFRIEKSDQLLKSGKQIICFN